MKQGTANLITDVAGVSVGSADDPKLASGVTAVIFDEPAVASIAIHGGAPAVRDTALLEPEMTVERVDAFVLSGGSAFGLDAAGGAMAGSRSRDAAFWRTGSACRSCQGRASSISPTAATRPGAAPAILGARLPRRRGRRSRFCAGHAGAGYGANAFGLKGGLGSASALSSRGFHVGALAAANPGGG